MLVGAYAAQGLGPDLGLAARGIRTSHREHLMEK